MLNTILSVRNFKNETFVIDQYVTSAGVFDKNTKIC